MSWSRQFLALNLPNKLTLLRMLGVPLLMLGLLSGSVWGPYFALLVFIAAALTDYWDGRIARQRQLVTNFGRVMDPLADKLLMAAAFICFVQLGYAPAWMVILIIAREFVITGLRILAAAEGRVIAASTLGKHKTISQIVAVVVMLAADVLVTSLDAWAGDWRAILQARGAEGTAALWLLQWLPTLCLLAAAVLSLYSGLEYLARNRHLFRDPVA